MNSAYDLKESAELIERLITLTRDGKIEWRDEGKSLVKAFVLRFLASLEGNSEVQVWSTDASVGFKVFERVRSLVRDVFSAVPTERDLISVSIDHENGPSMGATYINLLSLLELARRSSDKVEPKIDRVKQYLDKLAV